MKQPFFRFSKRLNNRNSPGNNRSIDSLTECLPDRAAIRLLFGHLNGESIGNDEFDYENTTGGIR